jgi:hypothetical protein
VAYVTFDGHRNGDFATYVFRTSDYGKTWKKITKGLPNDRGTAKVIRQDPNNQNLLFVGTEFGLFVTFDGGESWSGLKLNFPSVIVDDITVQPQSHDLILATHGRAFWVLDDIRPLEALSPAVLSSQLYLFDLQQATEWKLFDHSNGYTGDQLFKAPNPPNGATIDYYLASKPSKGQQVQIRVTNKTGELIQEVPGTDEVGVNRVTWDLRYSTPLKPTQDHLDPQYEGFFYNGILGPFVVPGTYSVQVSVGDEKVSKSVEVLDDPTIEMSSQDRQARHELTMQVYDIYKHAVEAGKTVVSLKKSLDEIQKSYPDLPKELKAQIVDLAKRVDQLHKEIVGPSEEMFTPLAYIPPPLRDETGRLLFSLNNVSQAPTSAQRTELVELSTDVEGKVSQVKALIDTDLAELNAAMARAKIPYIPTPSTK